MGQKDRPSRAGCYVAYATYEHKSVKRWEGAFFRLQGFELSTRDKVTLGVAAPQRGRRRDNMRTELKAGLAIATLGATLATGMLMGEAIAGQPHMRAALDYLRSARSELQEAARNKRGHRAEALRLTNEAISETEAGIDAGDDD